MATWSFELWLERMFRPAAETDGDGVCLEIGDGVGPCGTLTREHTRRLALHLLALSGHAPGPLPPEELEAIRARLSRDASADYYPPPPDLADARALLAHADALAADLAAAEGALHDLTSPDQTDGSLAYARGVEDERRRCVEWLMGKARRLRSLVEQTPRMSNAARELYVARIMALETALTLESPPAPAAAPGGE